MSYPIGSPSWCLSQILCQYAQSQSAFRMLLAAWICATHPLNFPWDAPLSDMTKAKAGRASPLFLPLRPSFVGT